VTARKVNGQTYREWRDDYLSSSAMTMPMDLEARRQMLFAACPNGFLPSADGLRWQAFIGMDSSADKRDGLVLVADPMTGRVAVDEYVQLAFDDFREVCIRRATLAAVDIANIREMALHWADANHQTRLDVDAFMDDIKRAAGL
jgi:hypothetical protein